MAPNQRPAPIPADVQELVKLLDDKRKPIVWVGAGASVAAGYPSTSSLVTRLRASARLGDIPDHLTDFTEVVDAYIASNGTGELSDLLHDTFSPPHQPTALHHAIARLAGAGRISAIITTNYDDLIKNAFDREGIALLVRSLEENLDLHGGGTPVLMKIHGSYTDWQNVILSGESYRQYDAQYARLTQRLDAWLSMHRVVFVGCSMQDPRILDWLRALDDKRARGLKLWYPMMTEPAWQAAWDAEAAREDVRTGRSPHAFSRSAIRPMLLADHAALPTLWEGTAHRLLDVDAEAAAPPPVSPPTPPVQPLDDLKASRISVPRVPASPPAPVAKPTPRELRLEFSRLVPDVDTIKLVACDAGIPATRIDWRQPSEIVWSLVLAEAERHGKAGEHRLWSLVLNRYPENDKVRAWVESLDR